MYEDSKPLLEIDQTSVSAADDRFEEILNKVKAAGGQISEDEEAPLYYDTGRDEIEIGSQRTVAFNINGTDFQIVRKVQNRRILGQGHQKRFEEMDRPAIEMQLKTKPELSDQWVHRDIEDLF